MSDPAGKKYEGPFRFAVSCESDKILPLDYKSTGYSDNPAIFDASGRELVGCDEYYVFEGPQAVRYMINALNFYAAQQESLMSEVVQFPVWNKSATAAERLEEVAQMARNNPERFDKLVIGWMYNTEGEDFVVDYTLCNMTTVQLLGLLRLIEWKIRDIVS